MKNQKGSAGVYLLVGLVILIGGAFAWYEMQKPATSNDAVATEVPTSQQNHAVQTSPTPTPASPTPQTNTSASPNKPSITFNVTPTLGAAPLAVTASWGNISAGAYVNWGDKSLYNCSYTACAAGSTTHTYTKAGTYSIYLYRRAGTPTSADVRIGVSTVTVSTTAPSTADSSLKSAIIAALDNERNVFNSGNAQAIHTILVNRDQVPGTSSYDFSKASDADILNAGSSFAQVLPTDQQLLSGQWVVSGTIVTVTMSATATEDVSTMSFIQISGQWY